jgi:hypothetical protein
VVRPATFRSLLALAGVSILIGSGFIGSCGRGSSSSGAGACSRARVGGKLTCLRSGQVCQPAHERVYRSYGLTCKPGAGGYRLRERTFIAPANP